MRKGSALVLAAGLLATSLVAPGAIPAVHAQEGVTAADLPLKPDLALCVVDPRPVAFFEQYVGTSGATPSDEGTVEVAESLDVFVPPEGQPADSQTVDAVVATVVELVACFNAGDLPRAFALYSDKLIDSFAAANPLPREELEAMKATPTAAPIDRRTSVLAVRDVTLLDDGRVGGFVDFEFEGGYRETQYAILVMEEDRWIVDEILLFAPSEGTPTP